MKQKKLQFQKENGSNIYPTKEEILKNLMLPDEDERKVITKWKEENYIKGQWKKKNNQEKLDALKDLIIELNIANREEPIHIVEGGMWAYMPNQNTITMDVGRPSIISALHELGHHIYGSPELLACQYSIGIFYHKFRKSYEKLEWDGHMLRLPKKKKHEKNKYT